MALDARAACIQAINRYREEHLRVVCSRSSDYLEQSARLRLRTAVMVQPLTEEQIEQYLTALGDQVAGLHEALQQESELQELAATPLMLSILVLAYQGRSRLAVVSGQLAGQTQQQVFASYVSRMLTRRGVHKQYSEEQIMHWLTILAQQMKRKNQTLFYIEQMQPDWLPEGRAPRIYATLGVRLPGIVRGMLVSIILNIVLFFLAPSDNIAAILIFFGSLGGLWAALWA
jgi:DNA-binding TFAR19-related protein (PDSD5 family)